MKRVIRLLASIAFCHLAGVVGALFTVTGPGTWYSSLVKPSFTPPNGVFAPVWLSLYTLIGIAFFLVWQAGDKAREARLVFFSQLVLNAAWPFFFFELRSPLAGLAVILLLWWVILVALIKFFRVSRPAGYLMVPYISWVSFAAVLNAAIFFLNR